MVGAGGTDIGCWRELSGCGEDGRADGSSEGSPRGNTEGSREHFVRENCAVQQVYRAKSRCLQCEMFLMLTFVFGLNGL